MPQLPVLDKRPAGGGVSDSGTADAAEPKKTPFKLSQLDLGSIGVSVSNSKTKRPGSRKRAATSAALDDDEDPLEEAQVMIMHFLKGARVTNSMGSARLFSFACSHLIMRCWYCAMYNDTYFFIDWGSCVEGPT